MLIRKLHSAEHKHEFWNVEYTLGIRFSINPIETVSFPTDFSNTESRNITRFVFYIHWR